MDLELWLPAWQPDRILEYPELEGATGIHPQQSHPVSHSVPAAGSRNAGAGQELKVILS